MAPFQENRSRFHSLLTILINVFHCVNQPLDVDCLLPAPILVEERIQSAQARICAQCCGSWPVPINDRRVVDSQLALDSAFAALFHEYRESVYDLSITST